MAKLEVNGLDALADDFMALATLPDSVSEGILNAAADVIAQEQKKTMEIGRASCRERV